MGPTSEFLVLPWDPDLAYMQVLTTVLGRELALAFVRVSAMQAHLLLVRVWALVLVSELEC